MPSRLRAALPGAALLALVALGLALRLFDLIPPERGLLFAADTDEGIYAASARLALDGFAPYRDYFCSAPPVGLALFMAVLAPTSQPWGDATGFMALRYAAVGYGLVTLLAVYAIGRRCGGRAAGLLSVALLAIDGWAVAQDRRAMMEAPLSMFSALAVLALLAAQQRPVRSLRWYAVAGALAALAMLTKTQGMVIVGVLLLTLLLQRQWRPLLVVAAAAAATWLVLSLPYLLTAGDDMARQLFVFQFLRPPNGDPALRLRLDAIRNYPQSWLTVRLGLLGALWVTAAMAWSALTRVRMAQRSSDVAVEPRPAATWLPVLVWALAVAASFAASKTFYLYYYAQLAPPLALLAGALLHAAVPGAGRRWPRATAVRVALVAVIIAGLALWRLPVQMQATLREVARTKTAYGELAGVLGSVTPPGAAVLALEPNYAFLASRPLARLPDGDFFVDTHAHMLYINLGIEQDAWPHLLQRLARRETGDEQALLWQQPAQDAVLGAQAQYWITDRRARYLLAPQTLAALQGRGASMAEAADSELRSLRQ